MYFKASVRSISASVLDKEPASLGDPYIMARGVFPLIASTMERSPKGENRTLTKGRIRVR